MRRNVAAGHAINRCFSVSVPCTRAADAAGADRSRMPVEPDVGGAADRALDEAYLAALDELTPPGEDPELAQERVQASAWLRSRRGKAKPEGRRACSPPPPRGPRGGASTPRIAGFRRV